MQDPSCAILGHCQRRLSMASRQHRSRASNNQLRFSITIVEPSNR